MAGIVLDDREEKMTPSLSSKEWRGMSGFFYSTTYLNIYYVLNKHMIVSGIRNEEDRYRRCLKKLSI